MIEFTEIFQGPVVYDEQLEENVATYELRAVYINPSYIITAKDNSALYNTAQRGELVVGLSKDIPYTNMVVDYGNRISNINVVGDLQDIIKKIGV